ncbi:DUF167 domain-containing protein [candidate division WOR-3 bacterium]|nr:DUF167 domain-containing protein [candidate division WOR-3 bacterium]
MLKVEVKVVPRSSRQRVEALEEGKLKVWVHSPPEKGRANQEVQELLAEHFSLPRRKIKLIKGEHSRNKTFELDTPPDRHNIRDSRKEV